MSSGENNSDMEVDTFVCKHCPGRTFTAAEKDSHRRQHRQEQAASSETGGRTTRGRLAALPAPAVSSTIFELVERGNRQPPRAKKRTGGVGVAAVTAKKRRVDKEAAIQAPKKTIRSKKQYDRGVVFEKTKSG